MRERFLHNYVLALHKRIFDSAHRAHRREEGVRALMHHVRDIAQVGLGELIDARLVSGAVDYDGRMASGERDDSREFRLGHEVRRLDVHGHAEFIRRLKVLSRRHEGVEADKVEAQLLALRRYHAVVFEVTRQVEGLREIAVLCHPTQIYGLAVQLELFTISDKTANAELLSVRTFWSRDLQFIALRALRRPTLIACSLESEVAFG